MGLGTLSFAGKDGWGLADPTSSTRTLQAGLSDGLAVVDTAWYYGPDSVLDLVGRALRPFPDDLILIAKVGNTRNLLTHEYLPDVRPHQLRADCERTLRGLGVDYVPLLLLRWRVDLDRGESFDNAWRVMIELKREGKAKEIGLSNVDIGLIRRARASARVAGVSNAYSAIDRSDDHVLDYCESNGIEFYPFYPLGRGRLDQLSPLINAWPEFPYNAAQTAILWLLGRSNALVPIPGTSSPLHLRENIVLASSPLDRATWKRLDERLRNTVQ